MHLFFNKLHLNYISVLILLAYMFALHNFYRLCMGRFTALHQWGTQTSSETARVCKGTVTQGSLCTLGYFQETTSAHQSDCGWGRRLMRKPTHNPAVPHLLNVTSTLPYIIITNSPPVTAISPLTPNSPLPLHDPLLLSELCFSMWRWGFPFIFLKTWRPNISLERTE